jgi:hypothetical protein
MSDHDAILRGHRPIIIGEHYSGEQVFVFAEKAMRAGADELSRAARVSPPTARAFLTVAGVKHILGSTDVERTKQFLAALQRVVDATKDAALNDAAMSELNLAVMRLSEGRR